MNHGAKAGATFFPRINSLSCYNFVPLEASMMVLTPPSPTAKVIFVLIINDEAGRQVRKSALLLPTIPKARIS